MKYFWIFLLTLYVIKIKAQQDTLRLYQVYNGFSNHEKTEWTAFENNWNFVEYSKLKKQHKIKSLNCKNCESFYADIYLEINDLGELKALSFIKGKICGQPITNPVLIKEFEASLKTQRFTNLKNKQFIARFGYILKC